MEYTLTEKVSPQCLQRQTTEVLYRTVLSPYTTKENIKLTQFSTAAEWCYGLNTRHRNTTGAMEPYINPATNATTAQPHTHIYQFVSAYIITIIDRCLHHLNSTPFKGYYGVVKDVLRGQDTASGLKIVLQLELVGFSTTFRKIVVDYDSVVEKTSVQDLHLQVQ